MNKNIIIIGIIIVLLVGILAAKLGSWYQLKKINEVSMDVELDEEIDEELNEIEEEEDTDENIETSITDLDPDYEMSSDSNNVTSEHIEPDPVEEAVEVVTFNRDYFITGITYEDMVLDPDNNLYAPVSFTGKVANIEYEGDQIKFLIFVNNNEYHPMIIMTDIDRADVVAINKEVTIYGIYDQIKYRDNSDGSVTAYPIIATEFVD